MINACKTSFADIDYLRDLFLQENNFQIRYNAVHERGWSDSYLISSDKVNIGYAAIKGNENRNERNSIFEFYIVPAFRHISTNIFSKVLDTSAAVFIECQSNDQLLTSLLYQFGKNINSDTILFGAGHTSDIITNNIVFRKRNEADNMFPHHSEPEGDWVLEKNKEVVATGGFLLHYNMPFADLYMEVMKVHRRKGLGSYLIQELKRECFLSGRIPAARCSIDNIASRATLTRAGMEIAGFMLLGQVK